MARLAPAMAAHGWGAVINISSWMARTGTGVVREDPTRPDPGAVAMAGTPYGAILPPSAIAGAAAFLASDDAIGLHGTSVDVDGGRGSVAAFAVPATPSSG